MPSRRQVLASLGAVGVGSTAGCLGSEYDHAADAAGDATDWPSVAHDNHNTGYIPDGTGPSDPTEAWSVECDFPTGLVVADGSVLLSGQSRITAYDTDDGSTAWVADAGEDAFYTAPTVHEGNVYVGGRNELRVFDLQTGEQAWRVGTTGIVAAAPTVGREGKHVYVGTTDATVAAVDIAERRVEWEREVFAPVTQRVCVGGFWLYVPLEGGELHALSVDDGSLRWRQKLSGRVTAAPAVTDARLYVGTSGGVDALGPSDAGAVHWTNDEAWSTGHLAVARDTIYATSRTGLVASDRGDDERVRWQADGEFNCPPAIAGDTLYVGDEEGGVNAFDATTRLGAGLGGRRRWRHDHGGRVRHVAVADGRVYAATEPAEPPATLFVLG